MTDGSYYEHARPEVLELIPRSARRVLDLGCGAGMLGAALKQRQDCLVHGIDYRDVGAAQRLDLFLLDDIDELEPHDLPCDNYDCIIAADVLEHLQSPEDTLRLASAVATPEASLVLSVPNARNWRVLNNLLRGDFTYTDAGLLDRSHRWFFTRREIEKLLWRTHWEVEALQYVLDPGLQALPDGEWVAADNLHYRATSPEDAREFWAYQLLFRCCPKEPFDYGLTSIIVPVWNQLGLTKLCLQSLRASVRTPIEVIVVDNGSDEDTVRYLQDLACDWSALRVLRNETNLGWVRAVNRGLAAAKGDQIVLLNNDTVLPTGWMEPLLRALHSGQNWGIVGPLSNNVSGKQCIRVGYQQIENMDGWAWDFMKAHAGQYLPTERLVGFCMAISRDCYEAIGPMDERFGMGLCDDDDWCFAAQAAGYQTGIVLGSFVHHWGSASFASSDVDWQDLLQRNLQLLRQKWPDKAGLRETEMPGRNE